MGRAEPAEIDVRGLGVVQFDPIGLVAVVEMDFVDLKIGRADGRWRRCGRFSDTQSRTKNHIAARVVRLLEGHREDVGSVDQGRIR